MTSIRNKGFDAYFYLFIQLKIFLTNSILCCTEFLSLKDLASLAQTVTNRKEGPHSASHQFLSPHA